MRELANYGAAALVFGQFVGERAVAWPVMLAGVAIWVAFVMTALAIERD